MSLRNVIGLSLDSSINPEAETERKEAILALRNPAKRTGALVLHQFAVRSPRLASTVSGRSRLSFVGSGAESTVYRRGDEVIKVLRSSVHLDELAKLRLAEAKTAENHAMLGYMSNYMLEQVIVVDKHPISARTMGNVVQIRQPFSDAGNLNIFETNSSVVRLDALEQASQQYPGLDVVLNDFIYASHRFREATGMLPDTNGHGNIQVSSGDLPKLLVIDGQPIGAQDVRTQGLILDQLGSLENAII